MKGDFLGTVTVIADCGIAVRRQRFIDGEKLATARKAIFGFREFQPKPRFLADWLTGKDACGRVI